MYIFVYVCICMYMYIYMDGWVDGYVGGRVHELMGRLVDGGMSGREGGWMNARM